MSPKNEQGGSKSSKSKWRNKTYNHKSKVQQFEERRRKSALHKYYKELKKSGEKVPGTSVKSDSKASVDNHSRRTWNPYEKAKEELEKRKKEKADAKAQKEIQKAERDEALMRYKKEKTRKFIKLTKKTKKGQPVMAGRMELLLEKIQKKMGT